MSLAFRFFLLLVIVTVVFSSLGEAKQSEQIENLADWFIDLQAEVDAGGNSSDQLFQQYNEDLQKAIDSGTPREESRALKALAYANISITKDLEKGLNHLMQASTIDEQEGFEKEASLNNYLIALIFFEVDDYFNSEEFLLKALNLNRTDKTYTLQVLYKSKLGQVYSRMGNLTNARKQYRDLLEYAEKVRFPALRAESLVSLADLDLTEQNLQEGLRKYLSALEIIRRLNKPVEEAEILRKIGRVYQNLEDFGRSLANYKASLAVLRDTPSSSSVQFAHTFNQVGELYMEQEKNDRALANLRLALRYGQESQNQELILRIYNNLTTVYKDRSEFRQALEYQELASALSDFLLNEKNDGNIIKMQNRYAINQQQEKIDQLEQNRIQREYELEEEKRNKSFIQILLILSLVILALIIFLFLSNRQKSKKLAVANEKVNEKNQELESANASKDKFFSIIGHDLKGPLNSLTSFSSLLMNHTESLSTEEIKMLATDLDKSLKNLFALLENLLEWSRSQTGNIDFTPEMFSINELLEENKSLLNSQAENKKISIEVSTEKDHQITAHKKSIDTVIRNLLSNAIKFTHEGGKIKMLAKEKKNYLLVGIQDNGVGMSEKIRAKIFDLDSKHSTKGTAKEKGTGLGLVLCKEFIEKNGGSIAVKSKEDVGSLFYFRLPLERKTA